MGRHAPLPRDASFGQKDATSYLYAGQPWDEVRTQAYKCAFLLLIGNFILQRNGSNSSTCMPSDCHVTMAVPTNGYQETLPTEGQITVRSISVQMRQPHQQQSVCDGSYDNVIVALRFKDVC